jgi:hypothetical protein
MVRIGLAVLLTAALSSAQSFEIRGTVIEPNTNHLLADVDVTILPGNGILAPGVEATKLTTDSQGAFRFVPPKVGQYVVRAYKEGYTRVAAAPGRGFPSDQASVMITAEKPTAELHLALEHTGELTGRVIDDETEAPLANFKVGINSYSSTNGHPSARGGPIITDAEGRFRTERPAGDYLVEIRPQVTGKDHFVTKFSVEDTKATDLDYRAAFFPGGPEVEVALPVPLSSGSSADFGTIRVRKQPVSRVYVNLDPSSCPPGEQLSVTEAIVRYPASETSLPGSFPCGPFLLTHMTPGTYELQLRAGKTPEESVGAVVRYTLTGGNLELPLTLSRGYSIAGRIVAAEGAGDLPFTSFKVSFGPVGTGIAASEVQPHPVDAEGRFAYSNIQFGRKKAQVAGLGTQYYIKQLRYSDVDAPGNIFDFTGSGELTIEIGRSPAALSGSVTKGDKAVPGADVVFLRWPPLPEDDRDAIRHIAADGDGKFQISGIVPGEYRIFAVPGEGRTQAERPLAWQRLVSRAEKVTLARGDSQNVVLEVGDPSR